MRAYILSVLSLCLGAWASVAEDAPQDLGRVMFIGDSITHGVGSASYRWPLHKILVDNGVCFEVIGVTEGNRFADQGVAPGERYRGIAFNNRHCSITSERAYEVAGRKHPSQRLGGSDLADWLGFSTDYAGAYKLPEGCVPDTCFILLGTNDILGDYDGCFERPENMELLKRNLLDTEKGDMTTIVALLRRANPQVRIIVLSIPTWEYHEKNDTAAAYAAVREYNSALSAWAQQQGVLYVDVFEPLADAACTEMPGKGVADFFYVEEGLHLHPSAQGDLLMAGRIARALGYHGRTLGQPVPATVPNGSMSSMSPSEEMTLPLPDGRLDFILSSLSVGNGAAGGWETRNGLYLRFGNDEAAGELTVSESGIFWGNGRCLYSADMSVAPADLRVAWVEEDASQGIMRGFYVWYGGQLIGEALPPCPQAAGVKGIYARNTLPIGDPLMEPGKYILFLY